MRGPCSAAVTARVSLTVVEAVCSSRPPAVLPMLIGAAVRVDGRAPLATCRAAPRSCSFTRSLTAFAARVAAASTCAAEPVAVSEVATHDREPIWAAISSSMSVVANSPSDRRAGSMACR